MTTSRQSVRTALLEAATRLMRERGFRGLTTREIAREAGCSDSALYVHFEDKAHLLAAVCELYIPDLVAAVGSLVERVGAGTVEGNLEEIAVIALRTYRELAPSMYAIAGDPELLAHFQASLRSKDRGPRRGVMAIAAYIAAEQRLGRVRADTDSEMAANLLLGSAWQRAAAAHFFGENLVDVTDAEYAHTVAVTLLRGLGAEQGV